MVLVTKNKLLFVGLYTSILFAMIGIPITEALRLSLESFFMPYLHLFNYFKSLNSLKPIIENKYLAKLNSLNIILSGHC